MVEDVFNVLASFAKDPGVAVVSGDSWASQQAKIRKFTIIVDTEQVGETAAIEMATTFCGGQGSDFTVVFPADIPLISEDEVRSVIDLMPERGCVIVPAADNRGTNAILRRPFDLIPLRFGNDSFQPHLSAARATGNEVIVRQFPGIGLDVDRPEDLDALMREPIRSRAQQLLLDWKYTGTTHA
jgi:2-phospho-L-lactate guanylyltransferase